MRYLFLLNPTAGKRTALPSWPGHPAAASGGIRRKTEAL